MSSNTIGTGQSIPPAPVKPDAAHRQRLAVAARTPARVLAGTLGAYGLTVQITVVASFLLARIGMARVEAVTAATLASFAVFACVAMAVFHAHSVRRAYAWLVGTALPLAALQWVLAPA